MGAERFLPRRQGHRPTTTDTIPHTQVDQIAPPEFQEALWRRMAALDGVETGPSKISAPGARAIFAAEGHDHASCDACMIGRESAHIHPPSVGSLHLTLPDGIRQEAMDKGWAEPHPLALSGRIPKTVVMVFGPRNAEELDAVWSLVAGSHAFALRTGAA